MTYNKNEIENAMQRTANTIKFEKNAIKKMEKILSLSFELREDGFADVIDNGAVVMAIQKLEQDIEFGNESIKRFKKMLKMIEKMDEMMERA